MRRWRRRRCEGGEDEVERDVGDVKVEEEVERDVGGDGEVERVVGGDDEEERSRRWRWRKGEMGMETRLGKEIVIDR
ncbi:hypothetical protein Pmani_001383 [Petrolisthes manimaculis]|uniref:Uncharacterized protein n=1 Tax=Petrolisthes manimaculis TaxID=1843537 RepID=A0AAE1QKP0_9EUCA|nr:hypothetical protein Pmani_001383 [Petrolisthes manimaculis]